MQQTNAISYQVPFTSDSNLAKGLYVLAALGGASPHRFQVDTGSVGILVPRRNLGPDYQDFDPSQDIKFGYVSSGAGNGSSGYTQSPDYVSDRIFADGFE